MALSHGLAQAGTPPDRLSTSATVTFQPGEGIMRVALRVRAKVPGIDASGFAEQAEAARTGCPVSGALAGVPEITLDAATPREAVLTAVRKAGYDAEVVGEAGAGRSSGAGCH